MVVKADKVWLAFQGGLTVLNSDAIESERVLGDLNLPGTMMSLQMRLRQLNSKSVIFTADDQLYRATLSDQFMLKLSGQCEIADQLDPVLHINQVTFRSRSYAILTSLKGKLVVYDLDQDQVVASVWVKSVVNCLGSLQRSSGFRLGVTLV